MKLSALHKISNYFLNHVRALCFASGEMIKYPMANLLTILVIAIAIALPFGLYRVLDNLSPISSQLNSQPKIALYTKAQLSTRSVDILQNELENMPSIAEVSYTSPQAGLDAFIKYNSLGNIALSLGPNPLPGVFSITPTLQNQSPERIQGVINKIQDLPNVSLVKLNMTWMKRLFYLIDFCQRIVVTLGIIFSIGVFLIVGNTIRLITQKNKEDINIMRLFGATPRFIRRPYLYRGLLLGLLGGIFAWLIVALFLSWLAQPLQAFTQTYFNTININSFKSISCIIMAGFGMVLSSIGAWFAVNPYLHLPEE